MMVTRIGLRQEESQPAQQARQCAQAKKIPRRERRGKDVRRVAMIRQAAIREGASP